MENSAPNSINDNPTNIGVAMKKRYARLIYSKALRYFAWGLSLSAIISGIYGNGGIYFVFSLCAFGCAALLWGWFAYLKAKGFEPFKLKLNLFKQKAPYMHRRDKSKPHRPAFAMDNSDFDDDLISATACSEEDFNPAQRIKANVIARVSCGAALIALSFFF